MKTKTYPEFKGRKVLITGSTGGIGLATARILADSGAELVLNYKENESNAGDVVSSFRESGVKCLAIRADMANADDCHRLAEETVEFLGGLDFLIPNAGPFAWGTIEKMDESVWRYLIDANYSSAYILTRDCLPALRKSDFPSIVYLGGVASAQIYGLPKRGAYGAAKAALAILTRTVANEEGKNGIRANMVCPGYIDVGGYSEEWKEKAVGEIPLGRIGGPDDVAPAVCWLLSREAAYITGAILDVCGGLRM